MSGKRQLLEEIQLFFDMSELALMPPESRQIEIQKDGITGATTSRDISYLHDGKYELPDGEVVETADDDDDSADASSDLREFGRKLMKNWKALKRHELPFALWRSRRELLQRFGNPRGWSQLEKATQDLLDLRDKLLDAAKAPLPGEPVLDFESHEKTRVVIRTDLPSLPSADFSPTQFALFRAIYERQPVAIDELADEFGGNSPDPDSVVTKHKSDILKRKGKNVAPAQDVLQLDIVVTKGYEGVSGCYEICHKEPEVEPDDQEPIEKDDSNQEEES